MRFEKKMTGLIDCSCASSTLSISAFDVGRGLMVVTWCILKNSDELPTTLKASAEILDSGAADNEKHACP